MNSITSNRLRAPRSVALLIAAFVTSLGTSFLVINDSAADAVGASGEALADDQAAAQVVGSAWQIVTAAQLRT
jgi:hypothetical protein